MERKLFNPSIYEAPILPWGHEYAFQNIRLIKYKELQRNGHDTLMLYTDVFYMDLYDENPKRYEKLGRVKLFIHNPDYASYTMAEIIKKLPSNREYLGEEGKYRDNIVVVDMRLRKGMGNGKYPFNLSIDAVDAEISIVEVIKRQQRQYGTKAEKKDVEFGRLKRLDDY